MSEFDLIKHYFTADTPREDVQLSIGDDCAITTLPSDRRLAITTDTLVCGTHFLASISPADLAYKAIAVNLSDLAAMGASPKWVSLAITLPNNDPQWLAEFSQSLFAILHHYNVSLIGGDTTKGSLSITVTAQGTLPHSKGLFRHKAQVGDWLYVSGDLGESAGGLAYLLESKPPSTPAMQHLIQRHLRPTPRVEFGQFLLDYSQCAMDISDGLLADLNHILERSQCGAEIDVAKLPLSQALLACYPRSMAEQFALTGGEDYELCFTIPNPLRQAFEQTAQQQGFSYHCIGKILPKSDRLQLVQEGKKIPLPRHIGFDHFSE